MMTSRAVLIFLVSQLAHVHVQGWSKIETVVALLPTNKGTSANANLHDSERQCTDEGQQTQSILSDDMILTESCSSILEFRGGGQQRSVDFGKYLADSYGVSTTDENDDDNSVSTTIYGGSLGDALQLARSKGRLLAIYLPVSKPPRENKTQKKQSYDQMAIESLLSSDVAIAAKRRARKKEKGGSYILWSAKAGSAEAVAAIKRLKVKKGKGNSPTLLVAYPSQSFSPSGKPTLVPRVLAQHHCNPPPSSESMASWLNTLRKRHGKEYAIMQHEIREFQLLKERNQGYKSSMEGDQRRKAEEKRKEKERQEAEKRAKEEEEALIERRKEFIASLPDEPDTVGEGVITLAIRFTDGRSEKRRFDHDCAMGIVFNWVDATFSVKREDVILSSMTGQKSFSFKDNEELTLEEAGLGKMVALRATIKEKKQEGNVEDEGDEDDDDEEEED